MKYLIPYFLILILFVAAACFRPAPYHNDLVAADSMLMRGNYNSADSFLTLYDLSYSKKSHHDNMYRALLGMARRYTISDLSANDFSMADSLVFYYEGKGAHESTMARIFLAEVYRSEGAYPLALNTLLMAEHSVSLCNNLTLLVWIYRKLGDIYFDQRMLSDCIEYYKTSFSYASKQSDTLRMAHSAFSMARVCMINNDADSAIYYLKKAIEWSKKHPEGKSTEISSRSVLADIYIQIEKFEEAAAIIPHDSLNDYNWAYWHLGQHHLDSAYIYFSLLLKKEDWQSKVEYLPILASLEEQKGNQEKALFYSKQLSAAKDSLKAHSQIEEIRHAKLLHHYDIIKQERDVAKKHNRNMHYLLVSIVIVVIIVALLVWQAWRKNYQVKAQSDVSTIERLQPETRLLTVENENIKTRKNHDRLLINELIMSSLYERIKENANKDGFRLTDEEWLVLATMIDQAYDGFTSRLRLLYDGINEYELHICYLIKLGISSTDIGNMLCKSKSAIGMTRQRLYRKLTGTKGTARELNDFITGF